MPLQSNQQTCRHKATCPKEDPSSTVFVIQYCGFPPCEISILLDEISILFITASGCGTASQVPRCGTASQVLPTMWDGVPRPTSRPTSHVPRPRRRDPSCPTKMSGSCGCSHFYQLPLHLLDKHCLLLRVLQVLLCIRHELLHLRVRLIHLPGPRLHTRLGVT